MEQEITQQSQEPAEDVVQQTPTESQTDSQPEPSISDVVKKYNVMEEVRNFTAAPEPAPQYQPQQNQQQYPQAMPDPLLDSTGFNQYLSQREQMTANALGTIASSIEELRREREQEALKSEINMAVGRVNERLNIDPVYAELLLEKEYRSNPEFKRIWDNRKQYPKALEEALDVISNKGSKVFQVKTDPQLSENMRAAKASQKAMASGKQRSDSDDAMQMNDAEFERFWQSRRGNVL